MLWANLSTAILAEESSVFSARIAVFIPKRPFLSRHLEFSQKKEAFLLRGLVHRLSAEDLQLLQRTSSFCRGPPASAECFQLLEALLVVAHLLKDRHVVPGGEQLELLGHMAKREALIISASIINTDVLQLFLIVGYLPMHYLVMCR